MLEKYKVKLKKKVKGKFEDYNKGMVRKCKKNEKVSRKIGNGKRWKM